MIERAEKIYSGVSFEDAPERFPLPFHPEYANHRRMLLAIDSGNTNIVFTVFRNDGSVQGTWRSETTPSRAPDVMGAWLLPMMGEQGLEASDISGAIIATVVPKNLSLLRQMCERCFKVAPLVVGEAGVDLGIDVLLDTLAEVGADRLVNAVAAGDMYGGPLICIDFGTATTFDVIDKTGNYAGGVIAPGIHLSLEALHAHAAKLPRVTVERPAQVIGTNTVSAMQSGIYWGYVALIEGMVVRIVDAFGAPMMVIATGGLSPMFAEATDIINVTDVDLTMRGLFILYQKNRS